MAVKFNFDARFDKEPNATLIVGRYYDDSLGLTVLGEFGEAICKPTVCLSQYGERPAEGNVFVYGNYSEHVGVAQTLQDNGFIGDEIRVVEFGGFGSYATEHKLLRIEDMDAR